MKIRSIICSFIATVLAAGSFFLVSPQVASYAEGTEALPSAYCMRDEYVVLAQNQDKHGYCWNFASTMAASTTIMKATGEYYDFSELWTGVSLVTRDTYLKKPGAGGSFSYQYNAIQHSGLMLECDLPYEQSYTVSKENVTDYYNFYEKYSNDDLASCLVCDSDTSFSRSEVDAIKRHIYENGSVSMAFFFRTGFIEENGVFALEPNQENTTSCHAVSVIGWDDNYQREYYLNGSDTPTVFKGAWIILNSYTETSGNDGISLVFYDDNNISDIQGYRYEPDTSRDLYFYDKIEEGYAYPTAVKGKYYGSLTAETALTKQKNIFYNDVALTYSYTASAGASIESVDVYLGDQNVTGDFDVRIDNAAKRFYVTRENADYGQYKLLVTYGNGESSDTYLNNFFVTHGLFGEEIEFDCENSDFTLPPNPSRDLEFHSFISSDKRYVIYTNKLSGEVSFLPMPQSVYSEKNMSLPRISYEIKNGTNCASTYRITASSGYVLEYSFVFEYYEDTSLRPVNVYYDLGGGVNHEKNYSQELASPTSDLMLYAPTREGYTFAGYYLDYGNGSKKLAERNGLYYIDWDDIHHMGDAPTLNASSYYKQYYNESHTVFVYAAWEEDAYYNVDLSVSGEGSSQIDGNIRVSSDASVRYLLKPATGWCLSDIKLNGTSIEKDELLKVMKYGLVLEKLNNDTSVDVTFSKGVYVSLDFGENVKTAYVLGTRNGETQKFYDGDVIPADYFTSGGGILPRRYAPLLSDAILGKSNLINSDFDDLIFDREDLIKDEFLPPLRPVNPFPLGTTFALVVEVADDTAEYTYVLDNVGSYTVVEKGVFKKAVSIGSNAKVAEFTVGSATARPIEAVGVTYTVGSYVADHYISADPNAESGDKKTATYNAGTIAYLFIKKEADTVMYHYTEPSAFEAVGNGWYRKAVYVNPDAPELDRIVVSRSRQTYTVTWKNWDGSVIYTETYRYGDKPVFYYEDGEVTDYPVRPDDDEHSYDFAGWDTPLKSVTGNVTYTATYEAVMRRYAVYVEPTENGTVSPNGKNTITAVDRHTYVFTPDDGYRVKDVIVNGASVGAVLFYTFCEVSADQTLRVEFEKIKHTVTVLCGENGSVDLTGAVFVEHGENLTVNITPTKRYGIDFVKVNGVPVEAKNSLTLANVTTDAVVEIAFKPVTVTVTTESIGSGSVTPSFEAPVGENVRVDFDADIGYRVKDVKIDGVSVGSVDHYTFVSVACDHTVSVEYEADALLTVFALITAAALVGVLISIFPVMRSRSKYRLK